MKFSYLFLPLILCSILFTACKDDDSPEDQDPADGTLTCNVDGQAWEGSLVAQALYTTDNRKTLTLTGQQAGDNSQVQVIVTPFDGVGTYTATLGDFTATIGARYTGSNPVTDTYTSSAGQGSVMVEVTSFEATGRVKGTFSFTAKNTSSQDISVTNGVFDIKILE